MSEYIERKKVAGLLCELICGSDRALCVSTTENCQQNKMLKLYELPVADAAPVRHGDWLLRHIGGGHYWECSVCHTNPCIYVTKDTNFCPNCGAKMDGGGDGT